MGKTDEADTTEPMTPWDRVANASECETFVFTVIAIHLGLNAEDRDQRPWNLLTAGILGASLELWELWEARHSGPTTLKMSSTNYAKTSTTAHPNQHPTPHPTPA